LITITKVSAANFLSFGQKPVELLLDTKNTRVILGVNDDVGEKGMSANGVGKSAIFNAIIFGLFGKGVDKLKSDEFINIVNGKKLVIEVSFTKGANNYTIRRGRKPNFVEFLMDGESLTLDAMKNTDEQIVSVLGFDYDIFMTAFFLSPHKTSFMAMSGPEQRSMIETMLSLDVLAARAETLKTMRSEAQVEAKVVVRDIDRTETLNKQSHATIVRLEEKRQNFEKEREIAIRNATQDLEDVTSINTSELYKIYDEYLEYVGKKEPLEHRFSTLKTQIAEFKTKKASHVEYTARKLRLEESSRKFEEALAASTKTAREFTELHPPLDELEEKLSIEKTVLAEYKKRKNDTELYVRKVSDASRELSTKEEKLRNVIVEIKAHEDGTCHVCGGDYVDTDKLEGLQKSYKALVAEVDELKTRLDTLNPVLTELQATPTPVEVPTDDQIDALRAVIEKLKVHLSVLAQAGKQTNAYQEELDALVENPPEDTLESIENTSELLSKELQDVQKALSEVSDAILDYEEIFKELRITKRQDIADIEKKADGFRQDIAEWTNRYNPFEEEIVETRSNIVDVLELEDRLRAIEKKETHIGYLIKLLTDSKSFIRRRILENYIPYLNKKINEHAESLGLPHVCEVNTDLSVSLTYMNRPVSYYNLSRGERLRLDLATTDAFRAMMGMMGKGCNLALLDEVLDSALDASGRESALKFICKSAETVLLITHREELSAVIHDKVTVVKRNGFSDLM